MKYWALPFHGRDEYTLEHGLWFSFSSSDSDAGEPLVERHTWGSFGLRVPGLPSQYV